MQSGSLWGRTEPMTRALAVIRGAQRHGIGGIVVIRGPAGVGKTALTAEVGRQASRMGLRVIAGHCDPAQQATPGAAVIAMLRAGREPLLGSDDYAQLVHTAAEPLLVADRIGDHLAATGAGGPLLIALDDLHRADPTSRFLLRTVISRLSGLPIVWVLAGRDDNFFGELAGADGLRLEQVRLRPLATVDLVAMAIDRLGHTPDERTERYLDATGGNPQLAARIIDSVARGAIESVPAEFHAAVRSRLAQLGDAAQHVVRLLAVAGTPLAIGEIDALLPDTAAYREHVVSEVLDSGLTAAASGGLACRHELVGQAVRDCTREPDVRRLHRRLAEYYLTDAGRPMQAVAHARAAAEPGDVHSGMILLVAAEALADTDAECASELATLAMQTFPCGDRAWLELSQRCLAVLCRTQRTAEAITATELILARVDDDEMIGAVETDAAQAFWLSGRVAELVRRTDRLLARPDLTPVTTARLRAARALASTRIATGEAAAREADAVLEHSHTVDDREAVLLALQAAGEAAKNEGRHDVALRHFRELRAMRGTSCLAEEITELQILDRYEHAQILLDQSGVSGRGEVGMTVPALQCAQMWQHFYLGRFGDADIAAQALHDLGHQLGNAEHTLDAVLARTAVALLRGDVPAATARMRVVDEQIGRAHV